MISLLMHSSWNTSSSVFLMLFSGFFFNQDRIHRSWCFSKDVRCLNLLRSYFYCNSPWNTKTPHRLAVTSCSLSLRCSLKNVCRSNKHDGHFLSEYAHWLITTDAETKLLSFYSYFQITEVLYCTHVFLLILNRVWFMMLWAIWCFCKAIFLKCMSPLVFLK